MCFADDSNPFYQTGRATTWYDDALPHWGRELTSPQGVEKFVLGIQSSFADEFARSNPRPWYISDETKEAVNQAGTVRTAGGGAGNFTFAIVYEAG